MSITIQTVLDEITCWRQSVGTRGRIPGHLKQQILRLLPSHSISELSVILGLKKPTLEAWIKGNKLNPAEKQGKNKIDFVPLPLPSSATNTLTLSLTLHNQTRVHIERQSVSAVTQLLLELSRGETSCSI